MDAREVRHSRERQGCARPSRPQRRPFFPVGLSHRGSLTHHGLHTALNILYAGDVASSPLSDDSVIALSDNGKDSFNAVSKAFKKAMGWLHRKRGFQPEMLAEPEPAQLITATHDVLATELKRLDQRIPPEMAAALDQNVFLFSGFKTWHQLDDASRLLKDPDTGGFKPFDRFLHDVQRIDQAYNRNYLQAEYNFATASTLMAARWADIAKDGDQYDLQYRTALDERVREDHAALEGITLPPSNPFWDKYYPPNGWNCRCTAVQVMPGKYERSDPQRAMEAGERATTQLSKSGVNRAAMFRFNPGKAQKVFPPKHPYLPKGCGKCDFTKLAYDPNSEKCRVCKEIREIEKQRKEREAIQTARNNAINSISDGTFTNELLGLENIKTGFLYKSRRSVKTLLHHSRNVAEIETAMSLIEHLDELEFVRTSHLGEGKNLKDPIEQQKIQKKIDRGVIGYNIYYYMYNGRRWVIKTEVRYDEEESLYSFTKKP